MVAGGPGTGTRTAVQLLELRHVLGRLWDAALELERALGPSSATLDLALRVRLEAALLELRDLAAALDAQTSPGALEAWRAFALGCLVAREGAAGLEEHAASLRSGLVRPGRGGGRTHARWKARRGG